MTTDVNRTQSIRRIIATLTILPLVALIGHSPSIQAAGLADAIAHCENPNRECKRFAAKDYVITKDNCGPTQALLVVSAHHDPAQGSGWVLGIEDPLAAAGPTNYWKEAWEQGAEIILPRLLHWTPARDEIGLAVNSPYDRSASILHIHIDVVLPEVTAALRAHANEATFDITPPWNDPRMKPPTYRVTRVESLNQNPFLALWQRHGLKPEHHSVAPEAIANTTLAVVGAPKGQFFVLEYQGGQADGKNPAPGHSEDLQIAHAKCRYGDNQWQVPEAFR